MLSSPAAHLLRSKKQTLLLGQCVYWPHREHNKHLSSSETRKIRQIFEFNFQFSIIKHHEILQKYFNCRFRVYYPRFGEVSSTNCTGNCGSCQANRVKLLQQRCEIISTAKTSCIKMKQIAYSAGAKFDSIQQSTAQRQRQRGARRIWISDWIGLWWIPAQNLKLLQCESHCNCPIAWTWIHTSAWCFSRSRNRFLTTPKSPRNTVTMERNWMALSMLSQVLCRLYRIWWTLSSKWV